MAKGKTIRSAFGSIVDQGDGRYRLFVSAGVDADGNRSRPNAVFRGTEREAVMELARMALRAGRSQAAIRQLTVYDFVSEAWLPTKKDLRPSTYRGYECTVENHVKRLFGNVMLRDLMPYTISQRLATIEHRGAAENVYVVLRQAFKYAAQSGFIDIDPMPAVAKPKRDRYEPDILPREMELPLLDYWKGEDIEAAVIIAISCGLRRSEICGLDWSHVKLRTVDGKAGGELVVERGYHGAGGFQEPKAGRSRRIVSIPASAAERLLAIRGASPRIGPLMLNANGERMTPDGITARWRRRMRADLVHPTEQVASRKSVDESYKHLTPPCGYISFKCLRHSHASWLLEAGVDVVYVSWRLGHASVNTTDRYYLRPGKDADKDAADAFDAGRVPKCATTSIRAGGSGA